MYIHITLLGLGLVLELGLGLWLGLGLGVIDLLSKSESVFIHYRLSVRSVFNFPVLLCRCPLI